MNTPSQPYQTPSGSFASPAYVPTPPQPPPMSSIPQAQAAPRPPHQRRVAPARTDIIAEFNRLKYFLMTAPSQPLTPAHSDATIDTASDNHPALARFALPNGDHVSCIYWNGLYHITGTDIVRALVFRFEAFGRPVRNMKKFEEGVFSDLRNLKPGKDATLEEPKSPFLDLLFKYQCIRTQKKQKVFYWFSVPHDRLFLDALERDLKREKLGQDLTTIVTAEPAASFQWNPQLPLYEQIFQAVGRVDGEGELERVLRVADERQRVEPWQEQQQPEEEQQQPEHPHNLPHLPLQPGPHPNSHAPAYSHSSSSSSSSTRVYQSRDANQLSLHYPSSRPSSPSKPLGGNKRSASDDIYMSSSASSSQRQRLQASSAQDMMRSLSASTSIASSSRSSSPTFDSLSRSGPGVETMEPAFKRRRQRSVTHKLSLPSFVPSNAPPSAGYRDPHPGYASDFTASDIELGGYTSSAYNSDNEHAAHRASTIRHRVPYLSGTTYHRAGFNDPPQPPQPPPMNGGGPVVAGISQQITSHNRDGSHPSLVLACPLPTCSQTFDNRDLMLMHLDSHTAIQDETLRPAHSVSQRRGALFPGGVPDSGQVKSEPHDEYSTHGSQMLPHQTSPMLDGHFSSRMDEGGQVYTLTVHPSSTDPSPTLYHPVQQMPSSASLTVPHMIRSQQSSPACSTHSTVSSSDTMSLYSNGYPEPLSAAGDFSAPHDNALALSTRGRSSLDMDLTDPVGMLDMHMSAPPTKTSFSLRPFSTPSWRVRPRLNRSGSLSPKEVPLRRFRSTTPSGGMSRFGPLAPRRSATSGDGKDLSSDMGLGSSSLSSSSMPLRSMSSELPRPASSSPSFQYGGDMSAPLVAGRSDAMTGLRYPSSSQPSTPAFEAPSTFASMGNSHAMYDNASQQYGSYNHVEPVYDNSVNPNASQEAYMAPSSENYLYPTESNAGLVGDSSYQPQSQLSVPYASDPALTVSSAPPMQLTYDDTSVGDFSSSSSLMSGGGPYQHPATPHLSSSTSSSSDAYYMAQHQQQQQQQQQQQEGQGQAPYSSTPYLSF